jgi:MFS family permease
MTDCVPYSYAVGLLLLAPLGDLVRRRQLILLLGMATTTLTIGLAVTSSLRVFEVVTFFIGLFSVTPQVLVPLAADVASEKRRGSAIAVVYSGLLMGVLLARVLAGIIAEFQSWRVVYYLAIGLQGLVLIGSYLIIPDYPSKNKHLTYWQILWSMAKYSVTEPILIQGCLINIASSAIFSNFWVTLTFLLGQAPYSYST